MRNRRGSALLIVLGFLSFMVVSAVAFSIYMRSERVPSSVFRKNAAVRQLVRAGLAHAISELDNAIRDDPYPGVIRNPAASGSFRKYMPHANRNLPIDPPYAGLAGNLRYIDWWYGRVFMPPNPDDETDGSLFAPESETVSVVTLEGLGYVPPPLINDVRILSRGSWSAKWRDFDYGVGRYAYCAVNVSDYFDINRMSIAEPRTGFNRVSLASLFTANETSVQIDAGKADVFEAFVANPGSGSSGAQAGWPLVSMLDYALSNERGRSGFTTFPFYQWIDNTTRRQPIYQSQTDDARRQIFVTDSWFPPSYKEQARPTLNLDETGNQRGQPFDLSAFNDLAIAPQRLDRLLTATFPDAVGENSVRFDDMLSGTEIVALYDYLDRDDIPSSLALPTVERNPMVVAISPQAAGLELKVPAQALTQATDLNPGPITTPVNFDLSGINLIAGSGLGIVLAYPFKHGNLSGMNIDSASYQVQAVAKIFLVDKSVGVGTRGKVFSGNYNTAVFRPSDADYSGSSVAANNVITLVARPQNVSFSGGDLTKDVMLTFLPFSGNVPVAEHISTWVPGQIVNGIQQAGHAESKWNILFSPIDVNGNAVAPQGYSAGAATLPEDPNGYVAVMAVWVRVKDVSRNFVADCVPATFYEDSFNGLPQNSNLKSALTMQDACGDGEPLLRFTTELSAPVFQYSGIVGGNATGPFNSTTPYAPGIQNWRQKTIWAVDPRYNHAPEDWCMEEGSQLSRQDWENKALNAAARDIGGDGDIYLAVSNQGFLQSMGELAFLPRVKEHFSDSYKANGKMWGIRWANKRASDYRSGLAEYLTAPSGGLQDMVWRTYEPWDNVNTGDNLFGCGIAEDLGGGFVNPYSDNVRVLMAALANTPVNWMVAAGTNTVRDAAQGQNPGDTISKRNSSFRTLRESLNFAYNENGSAASEDRELKFTALQNMANGMSNAFRDGVKDGKKWETIYDEWDWVPQGTPFSWAGSDFTDQLDSIDCRFLYSFWRGCFSNRQQLFLVFVRAESTALGGSGEGAIPPQQGGRAVALVWRDPETPNGGNDSAQIDSTSYRPHRTRVLFYHQFD